MNGTASKNRRLLGRWRKFTTETEQAMAHKKPVATYESQPLPPRMQRDIGLMGGMFSSALGRRS
ncbi:hypothetical protein [Maritalea myrionectae]|uniref:hypothetical protein n=1 Tax=Maritalea myrionectae TaxID=454601 RepID=UPI00040FB3C4|nr:hypothetical protein [Maritalea myrionectae]